VWNIEEYLCCGGVLSAMCAKEISFGSLLGPGLPVFSRAGQSGLSVIHAGMLRLAGARAPNTD